MVLKMSDRLMVVSCLKTQMISQAYIIINWLKHYGKRICSLVYVIRVVICSWVIFIRGNCTSCFFQSNDKWVYAFNRNIFVFKFYLISFFYIKTLFSLTTTYDIPFLQIHTTIYFLLVSCYIINVNQ